MKRPSFLAITLATAGLSAGYGLAGLWPGLVAVLSGGIVWLIASGRQQWPLDGLMLTIFTGLTAVGIWWGAAPWLMVLALVAALSAWDLGHFERRLAQAGRIDDEAELRWRHWQRLAIICATSLLLAGLGLGLQLRLRLSGAILLGLLIVIGIGRVVGGVRRRNG